MMGSHVRCPARSAVCFSAVLVGTSLATLCCPDIVGEPTTSFFFLGLCAIWVVDQPILDRKNVTVFVEFPYFSCRCSTEVSTSTFLCAAGVKDSSVTM